VHGVELDAGDGAMASGRGLDGEHVRGQVGEGVLDEDLELLGKDVGRDGGRDALASAVKAVRERIVSMIVGKKERRKFNVLGTLLEKVVGDICDRYVGAQCVQGGEVDGLANDAGHAARDPGRCRYDAAAGAGGSG
jgi:hypothetical protein